MARVQLTEPRRKVSIPCRGKRNTRISQQQREHGAQCRDRDEHHRHRCSRGTIQPVDEDSDREHSFLRTVALTELTPGQDAKHADIH